MAQNLYSLGLLRNGKVYQNKNVAYQAMTQASTNDGVAKLCRYLDTVSGDTVIRTLVGFYANASEMSDNGGGQSYYTILDVEGSEATIEEIKEQLEAINDIIGEGLSPETLTGAINEINDKIGSGFTSAHTIADALDDLAEALTEALAISIETAQTPSPGCAVTYILSQGTGTGKTEVGRIDIPNDKVVSGASVVHGYWSGDTFTEDEHGPDLAIKIEFTNADTIYINAKELVDVYTGGYGITIENNVVSIKIDDSGEPFITVGENGLKIDGIQTTIEAAIENAALSSGNGINIASKKINAVAATYSAPGVNNPITVDEDGIKFASTLDCGFFDNNG